MNLEVDVIAKYTERLLEGQLAAVDRLAGSPRSEAPDLAEEAR